MNRPRLARRDNEMLCAAAACEKVPTKGHVPVIPVNEEVEIVLLASGKKQKCLSSLSYLCHVFERKQLQ